MEDLPKVPQRLFEVNLESASWVEGRGVRHTDWNVRVNDTWVPIRNLRNVGATLSDPRFAFDEETDELKVLPAGCQYRVTYHPRLAHGTRLQKRVSTPRDARARAPRPEPLTADEALRNLLSAFPSVKIPLHTTVVEYRVVGKHKLVTEDAWQRAEERRRDTPTRERQIAVAHVEEFRERLRMLLPPSKTG
ncbi:MAG TPA: hypothetical protein VH062_19300 [Polyangiaceae bacterium]|jgi:hypothetical protein|nr:hypothetical protein [Polyangiaceae bacterium]